MKTPPKPFDAPWHGQAFALTVALNEADHFTWKEWTETLSAALKAENRPLDGSDDYYTAWVSALETMLKEKGIADAGLIADMKASWTTAFLATPHGQPVHPTLPPELAP